jgi:hypothetical protein
MNKIMLDEYDEEISGQIARNDIVAQKYLDVFDLLNVPREYIDVKYFEKTGHYDVGISIRLILQGILLGLSFALDHHRHQVEATLMAAKEAIGTARKGDNT